MLKIVAKSSNFIEAVTNNIQFQSALKIQERRSLFELTHDLSTIDNRKERRII